MRAGKKNALGLVAAALVLSAQIGSPLAQTAPSQQEISALYSAVAAGSAQALHDFLVAYPQVLQAPTALAAQLGSFMADFQAGTVTAIPQALAAAVAGSAAVTATRAATAAADAPDGGSMY